MTPRYTRDSVVSVHPFTRQQEGEEVVIGRIETGVFLAIPRGAVEVLEHLAKGKSVGEVADLYFEEHGEAPDLNDFLSLLETKGIVQPLTDARAEFAPAQPARQRNHFNQFPRALAQRLFSTSVLAGFGGIVALALAAVLRNPSLIPGPRDLFFPDHRTLCFAIVIAGSYFSVFVHELAHLIATRALGVDSRLGVGNRLWAVVAETDLSGLWSVPKRQRYLPLLAGAIVDAVSGALLVLLLYAQDRHWLTLPALGVRLVRAMAFTYVMRLAWQCLLFVRTDFYYVIASLFNCRNLLGDTEGFLRNQVARIIPGVRTVDQSAIPASERRVIRAYTVLWLAGRMVAMFALFTMMIPLTLSYVRDIADAFRAGFAAHPYDFLDAVFIATSFLLPVVVGFWLWIGGLLRPERN